MKRILYERIVLPTVLYGAETWDFNFREKRRLDVIEIKCLRNICGVTDRNRIRNEEVRRRVEYKLICQGKRIGVP